MCILTSTSLLLVHVHYYSRYVYLMQISQQADAKEESERNQSKKVKSLVQETKDDEDQR